jgi:hypothetical protein
MGKMLRCLALGALVVVDRSAAADGAGKPDAQAARLVVAAWPRCNEQQAKDAKSILNRYSGSGQLSKAQDPVDKLVSGLIEAGSNRQAAVGAISTEAGMVLGILELVQNKSTTAELVQKLACLFAEGGGTAACLGIDATNAAAKAGPRPCFVQLGDPANGHPISNPFTSPPSAKEPTIARVLDAGQLKPFILKNAVEQKTKKPVR